MPAGQYHRWLPLQREEANDPGKLAVNGGTGVNGAVASRFMNEDRPEVLRSLSIALLAKRLVGFLLGGDVVVDIDNAEALHIVHVAGLAGIDFNSSQRVGAQQSAAIMVMRMYFITYLLMTLLTFTRFPGVWIASDLSVISACLAYRDHF